jgi:hypothetical protein
MSFKRGRGKYGLGPIYRLYDSIPVIVTNPAPELSSENVQGRFYLALRIFNSI